MIRTFIQSKLAITEFDDRDTSLESGILDSLGVIDLVAFVEREDAKWIPKLSRPSFDCPDK